MAPAQMAIHQSTALARPLSKPASKPFMAGCACLHWPVWVRAEYGWQRMQRPSAKVQVVVLYT